jgi:hypothetical protein
MRKIDYYTAVRIIFKHIHGIDEFHKYNVEQMMPEYKKQCCTFHFI